MKCPKCHHYHEDTPNCYVPIYDSWGKAGRLVPVQPDERSAIEQLVDLLKESGATPVINGVKIVPRPKTREVVGGCYYKTQDVDDYITLCEARVQLHNDSAVEAWQLTQQWQKRVVELEADNARIITQWKTSVDEAREAILNERYGLAESGIDSDQVNAVLGIIDDYAYQPAP